MGIYDELSIKWDGIKGRINTVYVGHDYEDDYDITYDVQLTDIMGDDEIKIFDNFFERAKKVEELLDLYRLLQEFKERYNTEIRPLDRQKILDDIREIAEIIYIKEEELEEMK